MCVCVCVYVWINVHILYVLTHKYSYKILTLESRVFVKIRVFAVVFVALTVAKCYKMMKMDFRCDSYGKSLTFTHPHTTHARRKYVYNILGVHLVLLKNTFLYAYTYTYTYTMNNMKKCWKILWRRL